MSHTPRLASRARLCLLLALSLVSQLPAAASARAPRAGAPPAALAQSLTPGQRVLIVYNSGDADSVSVADYYATRRGVPAANKCAVQPPSTSQITYAEYLSAIRAPVQGCLNAVGRHNILYIVSTYNGSYYIIEPPASINATDGGSSVDSRLSDIWDETEGLFSLNS